MLHPHPSKKKFECKWKLFKIKILQSCLNKSAYLHLNSKQILHTWVSIIGNIFTFHLIRQSIFKFKSHYDLDKASGMMLSFPLMCEITMSYCCNCRLHLVRRWFLFAILWRKVSGLWSVYTKIGCTVTLRYTSRCFSDRSKARHSFSIVE